MSSFRNIGQVAVFIASARAIILVSLSPPFISSLAPMLKRFLFPLLLFCGGVAHAQRPLSGSSVAISAGDTAVAFTTDTSFNPGFRVRFDSTITTVRVEGNTVTEAVVYNRNQSKVETTYSPRGVVQRIAPAARANDRMVPHGFHYIFYPNGSIYQMSRWSFGELKQTVMYGTRGQAIRVFNYQHSQLIPPPKSPKAPKK